MQKKMLSFDNARYNRNYSTKIRHRKRKEEFFKDKKCQSCGSAQNLEFHHPDQNLKTGNISWGQDAQIREEEIRKCIILCRECHSILTYKQITKPIVHGTRHAYERRGCRCYKCSSFMTKFQANKRARKAATV